MEALARISSELDELLAAGLDAADEAEAVALIKKVESIGRKADALRVEVVDAIDRRGLHRADGHFSAKVMVRHVAKLSPAEAAARARTARALRDLPQLREAYRRGEVGTCQVRRLARAHANVRVRDRLPDSEERFVQKAAKQSYKAFDHTVTDWVRRVDEDGTCDLSQRSHDNRDFRITQDFDQSWRYDGGCGSLQGAQEHDIFEHFYDAETRTDWDKARAEHGDAATAADLPRTDAERRADAHHEIFLRAASTPPGGSGPQIVTNIVIDEATFDRRLEGGNPAPADPDDEAYRCGTLDGHPVEPTEVVAASLVGQVKRVVMGADSVVLDKGRSQRLFTGSARLAVQLSSSECLWPGCHTPVSRCQIDHLTPWAPDRGGGSTNPRNGGPACGRHNRLKETGYSVWRDAEGTWHVRRPDGTLIE